MTEDLKERLDEALKRRDQIHRTAERIQGRLESAREALAEIEGECRSKKIEPENLDTTIEVLSAKYEKAVKDLEDQIELVENQLLPFVGEETR